MGTIRNAKEYSWVQPSNTNILREKKKISAIFNVAKGKWREERQSDFHCMICAGH